LLKEIAMALITRLARLVRADLNAVLDRLEAPELVLAQAVSDMEQALDQERRALAGLDRELERLARRDQALADEETRCGTAVRAGLAQDSEDGPTAAERDLLVRPLIRRALETARRRTALAGRVAELDAERGRLAQRIEGHAARLEDLRARAALAIPGGAEGTGDDPADPRWDRSRDAAWSAPEAPVGDAEVELELLRLRRQAGRGGVS
jgi:phage shock protein A